MKLTHRSCLTLAALTLTPSLSGAQSWSTASLQDARPDLATASADGKAFFGGGGRPLWSGTAWVDDYYDTVDVYDSAVGPPTDPNAWSVETLSLARGGLAATSAGNRVIFAGGAYQSFNKPLSDAVDIYDVGTTTWSTAQLSQARLEMAATSVGGYALFAGGNPNRLGKPGPATDRIDVYHAASGTWSQTGLSIARMSAVATTVGPYALFAGGSVYTFGATSDVVDVYDSTVGPPSDPNAWSVATLSLSRQVAAATSAGGKAFFAGGVTAQGQHLATIDVYDSCIGPPSDPAAWSVEHLAETRYRLSATREGERAIFAGGEHAKNGLWLSIDLVEVFDTRTGTWSQETLSVPRVPYATTVREHALFAGGDDVLGLYHGTVDARSVSGAHWYVDGLAGGTGRGTIEEPFPNIQAAIDAASAGDTVHVAPGNYDENLTIDRDLSLTSSCGRDATVLTCATGSVLTTSGPTFLLRGFQVGDSTFRGKPVKGGGLYASNGAVTVEDSRFTRCQASWQGGAIHLASGALEVRSTTFDNNHAGSSFSGGGHGGALYGFSLVLKDCEFYSNVAWSSQFASGYGGALFGAARIESSLFAFNTISGGSPSFPTTIHNSTFHDSPIYAGGLGPIRNSILWSSNGGFVVSQAADVQYSIVFGGHPGTGNRNAAPRYAGSPWKFATSAADYRLRSDSPAIDAGDNTAVPVGRTRDLLGRPRFRDDPRTPDTGVGLAPVVDMGAVEFHQPRRTRTSGPLREGGTR